MGLTEKLIALRKQKGLTQLELAEALNVSRQAISKWELGAAVYLKNAKENERNSLSIGSISGEEVDSIPKTSFTIEW